MYTFEQKRKQLSADIGVVNFVTFLERFCFMLKIRKMLRCRQKAPELDGIWSYEEIDCILYYIVKCV